MTVKRLSQGKNNMVQDVVSKAFEEEEGMTTVEVQEISTKVTRIPLNVIIAKGKVILKEIIGTKIKILMYLNAQIVRNLAMLKKIDGIRQKIKETFMKKRKMMKPKKICLFHVR